MLYVFVFSISQVFLIASFPTSNIFDLLIYINFFHYNLFSKGTVW